MVFLESELEFAVRHWVLLPDAGRKDTGPVVSQFENVTGKRLALLARRAGCDRSNNCEATLAEQTGWWINYKEKNLALNLNHHPPR
jgi:hypothetical protein